MQKKYKLTLSDIEAFIDNCSEAASEAYKPYIDFDREPDIISSRLQPVLLHNSGIELFEDDNVPALYLINSAHCLIGCCTAFTYYDNDGTLTHELSVLIAPEYRRHGLGRMLVMQMLSVIEAVYTKNRTDYAPAGSTATVTDRIDIAGGTGTSTGHNDEIIDSFDKVRVLLVGSNEYFAGSCGFIYSHSEHFMTRKSYNDNYISIQHSSTQQTPDINIRNVNTSDLKSALIYSRSSISITRTSHRTPGHHTYRLFCDGRSASKCTVSECSDYVNIANVYTNKKYRGQGFAGLLIDTAAADFPQKKLLLQVSGSNTAAIRAYTGNGFTFYKTFDYYVAALS